MKDRFILEYKALDASDGKMVSLLQLLCSIENAIAVMNWYARPDNTPQESLIALSHVISHIGESLHKFQELLSNGSIVVNDMWTEETLRSWSYLQSSEVTEIKRSLLKYIRDKSTFHFDPDVIQKFIIESADKNDDFHIIWETDESKGGHSPIAALIIADSLIKRSLGEGIPKRALRICGAIRDIVLEAFCDLGLKLADKE